MLLDSILVDLMQNMSFVFLSASDCTIAGVSAEHTQHSALTDLSRDAAQTEKPTCFWHTQNDCKNLHLTLWIKCNICFYS